MHRTYMVRVENTEDDLKALEMVAGRPSFFEELMTLAECENPGCDHKVTVMDITDSKDVRRC